MKKLFGGAKKKEKEGTLVGKVVLVGQYSVRVDAVVGEGGFATIYRCVDMKCGVTFALKHMRLAAEPDAIKEVQQEAKTMARLKGHPNILRLHAVAFAGPPGAETDGFMLLDFCPLTLLEVLQRANFALDDFLVYEVFQDVARAVAHMHKCNPPLAHRDLKAENVLKNGEGRWVICDFGSSTSRAQVYDTPAEIAAEEDNIRRTTTPAYRAPEMWDLYARQRIDTAVDVWALGVLLYVLAFGKLPFQGDSKLSILYGKYDMPSGRPPAMRSLIQDMLQVNPVDRPDIFQVLSKLDALRAVLVAEAGGSVDPAPPGPLPPPPPHHHHPSPPPLYPPPHHLQAEQGPPHHPGPSPPPHHPHVPHPGTASGGGGPPPAWQPPHSTARPVPATSGPGPHPPQPHQHPQPHLYQAGLATHARPLPPAAHAPQLPVLGAHLPPPHHIAHQQYPQHPSHPAAQLHQPLYPGQPMVPPPAVLVNGAHAFAQPGQQGPGAAPLSPQPAQQSPPLQRAQPPFQPDWAAVPSSQQPAQPAAPPPDLLDEPYPGMGRAGSAFGASAVQASVGDTAGQQEQLLHRQRTVGEAGEQAPSQAQPPTTGHHRRTNSGQHPHPRSAPASAQLQAAHGAFGFGGDDADWGEQPAFVATGAASAAAELDQWQGPTLQPRTSQSQQPLQDPLATSPVAFVDPRSRWSQVRLLSAANGALEGRVVQLEQLVASQGELLARIATELHSLHTQQQQHMQHSQHAHGHPHQDDACEGTQEPDGRPSGHQGRQQLASAEPGAAAGAAGDYAAAAVMAGGSGVLLASVNSGERTTMLAGGGGSGSGGGVDAQPWGPGDEEQQQPGSAVYPTIRYADLS
ncbi:hypothetical protein GPECTOR_1g254 [Gonium pectorale]|uniref:non-specific serine/threonine protein kinase n=1 Tax=Gonium pectorale TaxID=33097 RepID=A0A150H2B7_GONPE|nr:hypothetical protein GPECTOR_1g254 [Gonium pectorale]|eukprot:KXZ56289.1 hypothetical protein GPECTOR_1g254 [Gonium pectorale]